MRKVMGNLETLRHKKLYISYCSFCAVGLIKYGMMRYAAQLSCLSKQEIRTIT